jgi:hypothetical protein
VIEYDVVTAFHADGIKAELNQRGAENWRLVYAYQAAAGLFGFSDGGHMLVFMREASGPDSATAVGAQSKQTHP